MVAGYLLAPPPLSRLPTHPFYNFGGFQALSPLHLHLYSHSRSRSRSCPNPCPCAHSLTRPRSRPRSRPCSRHRFHLLVPGTLFSPRYHTVGQASGLAPEKLLATCRCHLLPTVYSVDDAARGMAVPGLLICVFPDVADTKALLLPPFLLNSRSRSRLRSRPSSRSRPCSLLVPTPPVPLPAPSPLLSPPRLAFILSLPPPFPFPCVVCGLPIIINLSGLHHIQ